MRRAAAIAIALAVAACDRAHGARGGAGEAARRGTVHTGDLAERLLLTGELRAASAVELLTPRTDSWELSIRWMAPDGADVKAGDRVLEFDNSAFASQLEQKKLLLRQAEADLRSTRDVGALATADKEAELRQHVASLDKARVQAAVPAELLPGRTAQERQLDLRRAETALASSETELAAHKKAAALDLRVKQIELDKARRAIAEAEQAMRELVLVAPRDGVIRVAEHPWEGRKLHVGDSTQPGWTVMTLPELSSGLEVRATVSDVDDGKVEVGMVGACILDAVPGAALPCTVKSITLVARTPQRQSLRKVFDVVLTIAAGAGPEARPGMSVKIELVRAPKKGVLLVPRGAVVRTDGGARVRLPGGGLRDVTLGPCDPQHCVVEQGVTAGTAVEIGRAP